MSDFKFWLKRVYWQARYKWAPQIAEALCVGLLFFGCVTWAHLIIRTSIVDRVHTDLVAFGWAHNRPMIDFVGYYAAELLKVPFTEQWLYAAYSQVSWWIYFFAPFVLLGGLVWVVLVFFLLASNIWLPFEYWNLPVEESNP